MDDELEVLGNCIQLKKVKYTAYFKNASAKMYYYWKSTNYFATVAFG